MSDGPEDMIMSSPKTSIKNPSLYKQLKNLKGEIKDYNKDLIRYAKDTPTLDTSNSKGLWIMIVVVILVCYCTCLCSSIISSFMGSMKNTTAQTTV